MFSTADITATGLYLLEILGREGAVNYSRFYGSDPATEDALVTGALAHFPREDLDEFTERGLRDEGHVALERAAWQLEAFGIVRIQELRAAPRLIDGEPDYRIELTERGRAALANGLTFKFVHPRGYGFNAAEASRWLVAVARANSDRAEPPDFATAVERGATDGDVAAVDHSGNRYGTGTWPYEWAFQVALWHHVREGNVELVVSSDALRSTTDDFFGRHRHLFQHSDFPKPLWNVAYRLTSAAARDPTKVKHVGWIGRE
jgi:hypothetical protein